MPNAMLHLEGDMWWVDPRRTEERLEGHLTEFILHEDRISFDVEADHGRRFTGTLHGGPNSFAGADGSVRFRAARSGVGGRGSARCEIVGSGDSYQLRGTWRESDHPGIEFEWYAELSKVP